MPEATLGLGADVHLPGSDVAGDERLGERAAARKAAGAAVGVGQQLLDDVDPRVFLDVEGAVGQDEQRGQNASVRPPIAAYCPSATFIARRLFLREDESSEVRVTSRFLETR